jgi:ATP-binding cassette, subfamily B, bacterial MsbA
MTAFARTMWKYCRPYQTRLYLGVICGVLCALSNGALMLVIKVAANLIFSGFGPAAQITAPAKGPIWFQELLVQVSGWFAGLHLEQSRLALFVAILGIPVVMACRSVFSYLNIYLMNWAAFRAIADFRSLLFDHLQNLGLTFFHHARTGDLISRVTNDTVVLQNVIRSSVASIIRDPLTIVVMICILVYQHLKLTVISLLVFPVLLIPIRVYARKVRHAVKAMQACSSDLTDLMHEDFTCNRIIKAYNLEATMHERFMAITRKYVSYAMRMTRFHTVPSQLSEFFGALGVALVLLYAMLYPDNTMTPGDFIQFAGSIFVMYQPIKMLSQVHNQMAQASAAGARLFELLDIKNEVADPAHPIVLNAGGAPIKFEHVDFSYGEKQVLRGVDLQIAPGQVCALVGSSGSGKTTLTNLLLRFYDPRAGRVCIGATDIRQVSLRDLRGQIAVVTQETFLFNDTIFNNIALGRPGATQAEVELAARRAHAHEFIIDRSEGYQAMIGEKGIMLSGGQRQRLAIARAILKNAPILVLDEATSALDTESERIVQEALEELMVGRTTICIAHRLSTIQNADLIVVLDQGKIVETGHHDELLKKEGQYQKLHALQFRS